jgi:hypothetical protein
LFQLFFRLFGIIPEIGMLRFPVPFCYLLFLAVNVKETSSGHQASCPVPSGLPGIPWLLVVGFWLLVVACWIFVVGCWLMAKD